MGSLWARLIKFRNPTDNNKKNEPKQKLGMKGYIVTCPSE